MMFQDMGFIKTALGPSFGLNDFHELLRQSLKEEKYDFLLTEQGLQVTNEGTEVPEEGRRFAIQVSVAPLPLYVQLLSFSILFLQILLDQFFF